MDSAPVVTAVAVLVGCLLAAPARRGRRRLRRAVVVRAPPRARREAPVTAATTALVLDLLAAAVASGAAPAPALAQVAAAVGGSAGAQLARAADALALGTSAAAAWGATPQWAPLRRCLRLAEVSGAPVTGLLREAASRVRQESHQQARLAASRLSVRVVLPLGLCALPAFLLLGVAPVVLALAGQLLDGT